MPQFRYMLFVPRDPSYSNSPNMVHKDVYDMYDDFLNHLVLDETQGIPPPSTWSYAYIYIQWYFRVSHPYMTPDAPGYPPRITHQ